MTLNTNENALDSAVLDAANNVALFGTQTEPKQAIKVALNAPNAVPTRITALTLTYSEGFLYACAADASRGLAIFGGGLGSGNVSKVGIGTASATPTSQGLLTMSSPGESLGAGFVNPSAGIAYFTTDKSNDNRLISVAYSSFAYASRVVLAEDALVTDMRFYSYAASGNLRLAIYDNAANKNLLWQSGVVPNTGNGAIVTVPVSAQLKLAVGTYWLAWQSDSSTAVGSVTSATRPDWRRNRQKCSQAAPRDTYLQCNDSPEDAAADLLRHEKQERNGKVDDAPAHDLPLDFMACDEMLTFSYVHSLARRASIPTARLPLNSIHSPPIADTATAAQGTRSKPATASALLTVTPIAPRAGRNGATKTQKRIVTRRQRPTAVGTAFATDRAANPDAPGDDLAGLFALKGDLHT